MLITKIMNHGLGPYQTTEKPHGKCAPSNRMTMPKPTVACRYIASMPSHPAIIKPCMTVCACHHVPIVQQPTKIQDQAQSGRST